MSERLVIAGGGTGGHLYPGIAVADYVKQFGVETYFIVSKRGLERKVLEPLGYPFYEQSETPLNGVNVFRKVKSMFLLMKEIAKVYTRIKKGDKLLLTGGFVSAAAALVGSMKGVEMYLHEQNSVMGLTNRKFAGGCEKVFLSFPDTKMVAGKTMVTGNPVRAEFQGIEPKETMEKNVLILGGSQGSRFVNNQVAEAAQSMIDAGFTIRHQTGGKLLDETLDKYKELDVELSDKLTVSGYIDDVAENLKWADIVIARSGSGTVFEVTNSKRLALYIPFAQAADDHQLYNAKFAEDKGVAKVLEEKDVKPESLIGMVKSFSLNYEVYKSSLEKVEIYDSVKLIAGGMNIG
ncbi:MAG: UDP-N-acetylglucosamine--N-acetylmuramyl-(pentapeptide) pyrophosphoryl-undecaprenol N-acetylglucosamine transferase [Denitrovibrio sp.]|nr:MAG: UDP-N-acetylglucosamine--N-acetylmuramyl-(pentapeptide) pyrophosphoryl-undecaprenol N-acetylglucosamine transferase [Denitrovibrio sp.]